MALLQICSQFILPNFKAFRHMIDIMSVGLLFSPESIFEYLKDFSRLTDNRSSIAGVARQRRRARPKTVYADVIAWRILIICRGVYLPGSGRKKSAAN